jgi:hypothetical protein
MRSYALAARWTQGEELEAVLVYAGGLEPPLVPPTAPLSFRNLIDAYATYKVTPWLSLSATGDLGRDHGATFGGVAGYARFTLGPGWLALRGEHFADPDGFATGTSQHVDGITATAAVRGHVPAGRVTTLVEVRRDRSSAYTLARGAHVQDSIALAVLASW